MKLKFRQVTKINFPELGPNKQLLLNALYVNLVAGKRFGFSDNCGKIEALRSENGP